MGAVTLPPLSFPPSPFICPTSPVWVVVVPPYPIPFTGLLGRNDSKSLIEVQKTIATTVVPYYSGIEELGTELWVHCCWVVTLGFLTGLLTD
jgi:hypothetical protein